MARPVGTGKPEGTHYIKRTYTCPRDLWADVQEHIPERERSRVIQAALRAEVVRRKGGNDLRSQEEAPGDAT